MAENARKLPPGFDELPVEKQIDYVQFLWERIAPRVDEQPVPEWHHEVLDERLSHLSSEPEAARPAEEVVARLRRGLRTR